MCLYENFKNNIKILQQRVEYKKISKIKDNFHLNYMNIGQQKYFIKTF